MLAGWLVEYRWYESLDAAPVFWAAASNLLLLRGAAFLPPVTGGSMPAQIFKTYMSGALVNYPIAPLPGLPVHPAQAAEQQRLAEARRRDAQSGLTASSTTSGGRQTVGGMPNATRDALRRIAETMKRASAGTESGVPGGDPAVPGQSAPDRRAENRAAFEPSSARVGP